MAGANIAVPGGINSGAVRTIPKNWDPQWFRRFITDHLQKADFRNAIAGTGITITGTEQTSGTISTNGTLASPVTIPTPATAAVALTVNGHSAESAITVVSGNGTTTGAADILVSRAGSTANAVLEGPNVQLYDSTAGTSTSLQHSGGQTELWQYNAGWNQIMVVGTARNIVFNAPSSGTSLLVNGVSGQNNILAQVGNGLSSNVGSLCTGGAGSASMSCTVSGVIAVNLIANNLGSALVGVPSGSMGLATAQAAPITFCINSTPRLTLGATASVQSAYNFAGTVGLGSATAGTASALPSLPQGYWAIQLNGTNYKIPYYNN